MINLDYEESCMCKLNRCEYYDYDKQECRLGMCKNLEKFKNISEYIKEAEKILGKKFR